MSKRKTLAGRTFLITRTSEGNIVERRRLEDYGAEIVELPSIEILPPSSWRKIDNAISNLNEFDWVIFTSTNGVRMFFNRLKQRDSKSLSKLKSQERPRFACVGPATRRSLETYGLKSSIQPKEFLTKKLGVELTNSVNMTGKRVLLARAQVANKQLSRMLRDAGANVIDAPVYRTAIRTKRLALGVLDKITDITLTSPSTVKGLSKSVSTKAIASRGIKIHCIGPVTAKSARMNGLEIENVAKINTVDGLVEAIVAKSSESRLGR